MKIVNSGVLPWLAQGVEEETLTGKIFALDAQLLLDAAILACAVLFLFFLLSYLVFNPARDLMKKRQERIQKDMDSAAKDKEDAYAFKVEYEARLKDAGVEADRILADAKKKAQSREQAMIEQAAEESARILARAEREIQLEKSKVATEMKQEMVDVAKAMAGRFVSAQMDEAKQAALIEAALQEMGEATWQD